MREPVQDSSVGLSMYRSPEKQGEYSPWSPYAQAGANLAQQLSQVLETFWAVPTQLTFLGVSERAHYFWRSDDFHVSQLQLGAGDIHNATVSLRLSESLCASLLMGVLGHKPASAAPITLRQLSPLEATILNEFSRDLLVEIKKHLARPAHLSATGPILHLVWVIALEKESLIHRLPMQDPLERVHFWENLEIGKLVLSLPAQVLSNLPMEASGHMHEGFFDHVLVPVRLYLGSTRVTLVELGALEPEDCLVLENSANNQMALRHPCSQELLYFQARYSNETLFTLPYTQEPNLMDSSTQEQSSHGQLWDNLPIEVGAEFEPIKLPLRQLRQMSEGLVVEMGDLVHNQICLKVEGKTLAWGELIIVGDKFGVRITKVANPPTGGGGTAMRVSDSHEMAAISEPAAQAESMMTVADAQNMDTLLNEDFDESFDDEEDW